MDYNAVMVEIAARMATIPDPITAGQFLRSIADDRGSVVPPCAIVSYPNSIDPHGTYHRGIPRMDLQVMIVVGRINERGTRERAALWANDSGPQSVVTVLEAEGWGSTFDMLTVTNIHFDAVSIAAINYMAVFFDLDVAA
jgi:hypothetical protein